MIFQTGILFLGSILFSYGNPANILFSESLNRRPDNLTCCNDDLAPSCDQIDINIATLGDEHVELTPLGAVVQFIGMVGDNDHSYHYESKDLEMVITYHAELGSVFGHVSNDTSGDSYVIEYCGQETHVLKKLDVDNMMEDDIEDDYYDSANSSEIDMRADATSDTTTIVTYTVKVYYTRQFQAATADIDGFLDQVIQETNQGYINSKVPLRVKLFCSELATINEINSSSQMLRKFEKMKGSFEALRGTADQAALLVNSLKGCGIATGINTVRSGKTTSVTKKSCALGYYSFGHELGHNIGLAHNTETGHKNSHFSYGQSHLIKRGYASPGYRTILGYNYPGHRERINYYSNPRVNYPRTGTPTGVSKKADNAWVLTVQRFRLAKIGDESDSSCSGVQPTNPATTARPSTPDCSVPNAYRYWEYQYVANLSPTRCLTKCLTNKECIGWANHNTNKWCYLYLAKQVKSSGWVTGPDLSKPECNLDTASCYNYNTVLFINKNFKRTNTYTSGGCHAACKQTSGCISWDWNSQMCFLHAANYESNNGYMAGPS